MPYPLQGCEGEVCPALLAPPVTVVGTGYGTKFLGRAASGVTSIL